MSTIDIHLDQPIAKINKNVYGHFAEHLELCIYGGIWVGPESKIENIRGIRKDVADALKAIRVPVIRWPGGCFADDYHWMDGIGPREARPTRLNRWWGGLESNEFGTHEFLDFCALIGAEPYICGNVGSGSPAELSAWVEYVNCDEQTSMVKRRAANGHPAPFKVRYWGIGNESWGCGGNMGPSYYANEYRRYATYLAGRKGQELFKIACGANSFDFAWTDKVLAGISGKTCQCGSMLHAVDGLAFHYYCGTTGSATDYDELQWYTMLMKAMAIEELIEEHRRVMDKHDPHRNVGLICDEWGTWHPPVPSHPGKLYQQSSIRDALVAAMTLDIFNRHAGTIVMANIAQTVNVLQSMILTDGPKMLLTPTYHVYDMYKVHQDATSVSVGIKTDDISAMQVPRVSGSCSVKDGIASLTVVNCHVDAPANVNITFSGNKNAELVSFEVLSAKDIHDHNTFDRPETVKPATMDVPGPVGELPPASVSLIRFKV